MLGIGGVHALEAVGLSPTVCHMNEGHSAFLALERIGRVMRERGATFAVASEACSAGNIFTTHTPVPAGNDAFAPELVRRYLEPYRAALGISRGRAALGSAGSPRDASAPFSMPVLAIHTSDHYNGVSELHGEVSRKMWQGLWPELPDHEIPIESITNGVHTASWVSDEMGASSRATRPALGRARPTTGALGARLRDPGRRAVAGTSTGATASSRSRAGGCAPRRSGAGRARRDRSRRRGPRPARADDRLRAPLRDLQARGAPLSRSRAREEAARRSRAARAARLRGQGAPAGQGRQGAHSLDRPREPRRRARGKVVFIEDYDMRIARAMVSGVDVWLNTPRRPLEASGTSGMKAAANGALNVSVLDGWWAEAWATTAGDVGWAIGRGEEYTGRAAATHRGRASLRSARARGRAALLPARADTRPPAARVDQADEERHREARPREFNTARMVREYAERFYARAKSPPGKAARTRLPHVSCPTTMP
jgi:starch phosphorylase